VQLVEICITGSGGKHLISIEQTVITQMVVLEAGIRCPVAVAFRDEVQGHHEFDLGGEDCQPGSSRGPIKPLIKVALEEVHERWH
jgi:hypothetical protein